MRAETRLSALGQYPQQQHHIHSISTNHIHKYLLNDFEDPRYVIYRL